MATKKVNIDLIAKDKTRQAMQSATKGVDGVKSSVINLKNALIGLGAGVAIKGFVDVGKSVESLQVRLKFLFGSVEEGARAFDAMAKFAGKVPFSLGEIQAGSGVLAVVSKDANELSKILELTGNVAAVTGLDFRTTAEQIQRSLSAGISSADLFREKGVKSMLGFSAGATVSVEQTREALFRVFGKDGDFAGATDDLANTLEGTLSMIGDKFFNFQKTVAEEFFVALKKEFGAFDKTLAANEATILEIAETVGKGLAGAVTLGADAIRFLNDNIEAIKKAGLALVVFGMTKAFIGLTVSIRRAGIAMMAFNKISMKNLAGVIAAGTVLLADYLGILDKLLEKFEKPKTIEDFVAEVTLLNEELSLIEVKDFTIGSAFTRMQDKAHALMDAMRQMQKEVGENSAEFLRLEGLIESVRDELMKIPLQEIEFGFDNVNGAVNKLSESFKAFGKGFFNEMQNQKNALQQFEEAGKKAFTNFSNMLADSLFTGKLAFKDFTRSVLQDIARIISKQLMMLAIQKALGFFGVTSIFGVSTSKIFGFADGGRPAVGRPSIIGEKGPELFVPDQAGTVVPNNQLGMSKPVTVNFNINTVDARGFNELLVNSRGVIVNMINSAVNEKGKAALI
tara:strand:+ start:899 stop:2770 length:1872 start_codon:yes stop_codon:yes gene_type:complete